MATPMSLGQGICAHIEADEKGLRVRIEPEAKTHPSSPNGCAGAKAAHET